MSKPDNNETEPTFQKENQPLPKFGGPTRPIELDFAPTKSADQNLDSDNQNLKPVVEDDISGSESKKETAARIIGGLLGTFAPLGLGVGLMMGSIPAYDARLIDSNAMHEWGEVGYFIFRSSILTGIGTGFLGYQLTPEILEAIGINLKNAIKNLPNISTEAERLNQEERQKNDNRGGEK